MSCASTARSEYLTKEYLLRLVHENDLGVEIAGKFQWDRSTLLDYRFESSPHGNGVLELGGMRIHVYDVHDNGSYYEGEVLNIDLIHKGNLSLLIFSGVVIWTGEKRAITGRDEIVLIFTLSKKHRLELLYESPAARRMNPDRIEQSNQ